MSGHGFPRAAMPRVGPASNAWAARTRSCCRPQRGQSAWPSASLINRIAASRAPDSDRRPLNTKCGTPGRRLGQSERPASSWLRRRHRSGHADFRCQHPQASRRRRCLRHAGSTQRTGVRAEPRTTPARPAPRPGAAVDARAPCWACARSRRGRGQGRRLRAASVTCCAPVPHRFGRSQAPFVELGEWQALFRHIRQQLHRMPHRFHGDVGVHLRERSRAAVELALADEAPGADQVEMDADREPVARRSRRRLDAEGAAATVRSHLLDVSQVMPLGEIEHRGRRHADQRHQLEGLRQTQLRRRAGR